MKLLMILFGVTAAGLAACTPSQPPAPPVPTGAIASERACTLQGGVWRPAGRLQTLQCILRYSDGGRACTSGDQCQGDCRAAPERVFAEGAPASGQCQASSDRFGCYTRIVDGRAEATICVD